MFARVKRLLLSNTNHQQTVAKNTVWLFLAETISRLFRAVLIIFAARVIGSAGLGVFSFAMALGSLFFVFEDSGIGVFVTRELISSEYDQKSLLATSLVIKATLLIATSVIFLIFGKYASSVPGATAIIPLMTIVLLSDSLREFFFAIYRSEQKMQSEALVKFITNFLVLACGVVLVILKPTAFSLALGYAIGGASGFLILILLLRKKIWNPIRYFNQTLIRPIMTAAWPFTILIISNTVILNTDTFFLGHFAKAPEIGAYAAAQRFIQLCYVIPSLFASATFPVFAKKLASGQDFKPGLEKVFAIMISVVVPLSLGVILWSSQLIRLVFGPTYQASGPMLEIIALGLVPVFITTTYFNVIFAQNKQNKFVAANITAVIVNVLLDLVLIPKFHGIGAAAAGTISLTLIAVITYVQFSKHAPISIFRYIKIPRFLLSNTILIAISFICIHAHINVVPGIILAALGYIICLLITHINTIRSTGFIQDLK